MQHEFPAIRARNVSSASTVQRIWSKNELKPHVTRTFKLSNDPRLHPPWHHYSVCRPGDADRRTHHAHGNQPHACRMAPLSQADRPRDAETSQSALDRRQLCDPQASQGEGMARPASALYDALHANIIILAQPGRAFLCRSDG